MSMHSLKKQLVRYTARYTLLLETSSIVSPWDQLRNILIAQQCAAIEIALAERGWKLHVAHDEKTGFPFYIAVNKYGRKKQIRYPEYQKEMARLR
ncbi:hypothetical protein JAG44_000775 [Citrobacter koseri]|nr:hypothetical protein [Citrobacter koseri]